MMKNDDQSLKRNHNPNWPYIPNHPCIILTIGGSGSDKTNVLINDKILAKFICQRPIQIKVSVAY